MPIPLTCFAVGERFLRHSALQRGKKSTNDGTTCGGGRFPMTLLDSMVRISLQRFDFRCIGNFAGGSACIYRSESCFPEEIPQTNPTITL